MAFELGILAAFGAMLCWGFGDFFIQRTTRKVGDIEALAFIGGLGALGLLPFMLGELPLLFSVPNLVLLAFVGFVTFVAAMFNFEALKKGKLCVVEVVLEIELPVTAMLGVLFFKETILPLQLLVMILVFVGIVLISSCSLSCNHFKRFEKGVVLAFLAAIGMGLVNFLTAVGAKQVSPLLVIWMPWLVIAIMSLFFVWRREGVKRLWANAIKFKTLILLTAFFDTLAWLFYATAVLKNELVITTAITESYPAVALFLGLVFNKEKILSHQYAGAALALAASLALGFLV